MTGVVSGELDRDAMSPPELMRFSPQYELPRRRRLSSDARITQPTPLVVRFATMLGRVPRANECSDDVPRAAQRVEQDTVGQEAAVNKRATLTREGG